MNRVTVDAELQVKLNGLTEQTELYDDSGNRLGYFLPADVYRELLNALVDAQFTEEELERRRQETGGRTLAEIWRSLGPT